MKTNNLVPTETHFKIVLDLQVPHLMVSQVTQNDIQTALTQFFQQHPQMLSRVLETFGTTSALELPTPLPRVTKRQRETLLATLAKTPFPLEEANSAQWIKGPPINKLTYNDAPPVGAIPCGCPNRRQGNHKGLPLPIWTIYLLVVPKEIQASRHHRDDYPTLD